MKTKLIPVSLAVLALASASSAQTTLAGWSFSQFIGEGYPSVDGVNGDSTNFIVATYRGNFNPDSSVVDGSIVAQNSAAGYVDPQFGSWNFSNFNTNNAVDVRADTLGTLGATNGTTLDGKLMYLTDSAGALLSFNQLNTLWTITVADTVGYTNVAGADNDVTFAATTTTGATIEWFYNGNQFATSNVTAPLDGEVPFQTYSFDFSGQAAGFYSTGVITGRLTSGSVKFDNFQVNGTAIPEASSFAALAGFAALGFVGSRRRR
jgi:hypothetical protein